MDDTCGIPNRADWHVHVDIDQPPGYVDIYVCDEHMPRGIAWDMTTMMVGERDEKDVRSLFRFDGSESCEVFGFTVTRLR